MTKQHAGRFAFGALLTCAACNEPAASATPGAAPATETQVNAAGDGIGVPECDDYLNKYQACVASKVPEAARASMTQALDQMRSGWRTAATTPEGKAGLASACSQARAAMKTSMSAYGCTEL